MKWTDEIVQLVFVKQALADVDKTKLWPYHLPNTGAPLAEINNAESLLDFEIDAEFKGFLLAADGWSGLYQEVDLFGTGDLVGKKAGYALTILGALDDSAIRESGVGRDDLFPIAVSAHDRDIFAMTKPHCKTPGEVFWFSGGLVDKFSSFAEFFLAMVDYNREEIVYFKQS